jgi:hypothetical protein
MLYVLSAIVGLVAIVSPTFAQDSSPIIGPRARPPDGARYSAVEKGLDLTHPQRRWLYANIAHSGVVAPTGFQPKLGMIVPSEIELQPLPPAVIKKMPALKHYRYAKVDLKVLLVDERRALVEIVENPLL